MIVVDASALLAIYLDEPERHAFSGRLADSDQAIMSAINAWEVMARAHALRGERGRIEATEMIEGAIHRVVEADWRRTRLAADAFALYGRRTRAKLNLGDCFAYALAKELGAPLLFKGDDFAKTDVVPAL